MTRKPVANRIGHLYTNDKFVAKLVIECELYTDNRPGKYGWWMCIQGIGVSGLGQTAHHYVL